MNIIEIIESLLGTSPSEEITFLYYILGGITIIYSMKLIFKMIFDYIFNIKL